MFSFSPFVKIDQTEKRVGKQYGMVCVPIAVFVVLIVVIKAFRCVHNHEKIDGNILFAKFQTDISENRGAHAFAEKKVLEPFRRRTLCSQLPV